MKTSPTSQHKQTGAYLLEALIGILIFSLGVLGIVGLQGRAEVSGQLMAEAVFAANQLVGQMWTDNELNLVNYTSAIAAQPYKDFAAQLKLAQGGAYACDPTVQLDNFAAVPSQTMTTPACCE